MVTTRYTIHVPGRSEPTYATYCEDTAFGVAQDEARGMPSGSGTVEIRDMGERIGGYVLGRYPSRVI